jgi:hypothetical protein
MNEKKKGPGSRFVQIDSDLLETFLKGCGFSRIVQGREIVYVRANGHCPAVRVKVYTSIAVGEKVARECGADAIRVTAAYEGQRPIRPWPGRPPSTNFAIFKGQKILRTGTPDGVIERLHERMREAYIHTNGWIRDHWADLGGGR